MSEVSKKQPLVWQPYMDDPVLTPAMAEGYDAVPRQELQRLRQYLDAVVASRRGPVHTTIAFNAAYFGYETTGEGYGNSPLDPDTFPVVTFGESMPALPVGAMVQVATGTEPLYAEVVYKEGRRPEVDALGSMPEWVSGAPVGATGPETPSEDARANRRELLVPQFDVFGPALALRPAQLQRLRSRSRWIDRNGHVLVDAHYPSRSAAEQDDLSAYADHLLTSAWTQLLSPLVPVSLVDLAGSSEPEALRGALHRILDVVHQVTASSDALRRWGFYALTRAAIAEGLKHDGPLGGKDMATLASAVQRSAKPQARRRYGMPSVTTTYTAIGSRVSGFQGAEPLLAGVDYATTVCRANLALVDVIRGESDHGLFDDGTRVSLDDAFEHGGIWRARNPGTDEAGLDPLEPLGLGWREMTDSRGSAHETRFPPQELGTPEPPAEAGVLTPLDSPLSDDADLGLAQILRIADTEFVWRMPLRLTHLMEGFLPVRPMIADELRERGGAQVLVRLELAHPGGELDDSETVQDTVADFSEERCRLTGVEWPLDFFPGLELHLRWPRGGRVIQATTTPLDVPVTIDGKIVEYRYDVKVLTRENSPGSSRVADSATGLKPTELVMRAVRRCGLLTADGHALLDRAALPGAIYGPETEQGHVVGIETTIEELLAHGRLYATTGSRDAQGQPHYPARAGEELIPLVGYNPKPTPAQPASHASAAAGHDLRTSGTQYHVHGFLRRLPPGHTPTDLQRSAYRDHCRKLGKADGWELPRGYTFVTQHSRTR